MIHGCLTRCPRNAKWADSEPAVKPNSMMGTLITPDVRSVTSLCSFINHHMAEKFFSMS